MSQLDEKALRRPEFTEGYKVALADSQEWTFPKPVVRFFPARTPEGKMIMGADYGYDAEYEALRDELVEADPDDGYNVTRIEVQIAGLLLLRNYDLDNKQLRELLPYIPGSEANDAMWEALVPIVMASPPRTFPDGSDAP